MLILHDILAKLKDQFADSRKADERGIWFVYTIVAIIFGLLFPVPRKSRLNSFVNLLLRMAA